MAKARKWKTYIEGADELIALFENMESAAKDIITEATMEAANIVKDTAKRKCPVDSGKLRDSIDIKQEKTKKMTKAAWRVYTKGVKQGGVRYGFAVEGGTKDTKAQPFLRPALDENYNNVRKKISEVIVKRLEGVN